MADKEEKNILVRIKSDGRVFKTPLGNLVLNVGDEVLFEFEQGQDVGVVIPEGGRECISNNEEDEKFAVIRKLTEKDLEKLEEKKEEAKETITLCEEKIKKHGLSMDLLDADLSYDGKKLTFYFSAPGRVDFRTLVPDLASTFKKLIRLQQVSSRDKAKCVDGIGRCGREFCCKKFGSDKTEDVTQEMATVQNLGQMGANRVTGSCGKMMCCLKYEIDFYNKAKAKMPQIGSKIKTVEGEGIVLSQNVINNRIKVELNKDRRIVEVDC